MRRTTLDEISSNWLGWGSFLFVLQALVFPHVFASELPKCLPNGPYHNCFGTYIWGFGHKKGDKYKEEFINNKFHWTGTYYFVPKKLKFLGTDNHRISLRMD